MNKVLTTCGYCGCGCNYYINVENNEIAGVTPKHDHVVSRGKLCSKGWQGYSFVNHPDRLRHPLIKDDEGKFRKATWDEAIDYISSNLNRIIGENGPSSVGILSSARCTNEENYLLTKLARQVMKTSNIDHCARL
jgi:predicted molibdopterin-dependent oxidoreductase YjgC